MVYVGQNIVLDPNMVSRFPGGSNIRDNKKILPYSVV